MFLLPIASFPSTVTSMTGTGLRQTFKSTFFFTEATTHTFLAVLAVIAVLTNPAPSTTTPITLRTVLTIIATVTALAGTAHHSHFQTIAF